MIIEGFIQFDEKFPLSRWESMIAYLNIEGLLEESGCDLTKDNIYTVYLQFEAFDSEEVWGVIDSYIDREIENPVSIYLYVGVEWEFITDTDKAKELRSRYALAQLRRWYNELNLDDDEAYRKLWRE